jgi:PleD family two-component response regulator
MLWPIGVVATSYAVATTPGAGDGAVLYTMPVLWTALTGLLNRRGLEERAGVELARSRRDNTPMAVASFDLDHFKHINDEWGHETGDRVLVSLG